MHVRQRLISLVSWLALFVISVSGQTSKIFGVYGQCPFACRYIQINTDHTFEELLTGDLFNGQRKHGSWTYIGKDKIKAESHKPSHSLQVTESKGEGLKSLVTVYDWAGAVMPGVRITASVDGKTLECVTHDDGSCVIPIVGGFDLEWNHFSGSYAVLDPASNLYKVELTSEQLDTVIDEIWIIKGDQLLIESASLDNQEALKKVRKDRARKLFPNDK